MSTLYLLRGMPGSGKSTLIENLGLESHTISLDTFRELFSGVSIDSHGKYGIDQSYNNYIMRFFNQALKTRLQEGAIIVIDNLNVKLSDMNSYIKLANEYNYDVKVVNFELNDFDFYLKRNDDRPERKQLPVPALERIYKSLSEIDISKSKIDFISTEDFKNEINQNIDTLKVDLNKYKNIKVIGDIKGNIEPLQKMLSDVRDDTFYIFTGNYFNDGEYPEQVLRYLSLFIDNDNFVFIKGFDETKITDYYNGRELDDPIFYRYTEDSLKLNKKEFHSFINKLKPYFIFDYNNKNYFLSHAGVYNLPDKPFLINQSCFVKGTGYSSDNIDSAYSNNCLHDNWIQIHGGRNITEDNCNNLKSISLNSNIKSGGFLKSVSIDKDGIETIKEVNNNVLEEIKEQLLNEQFKNYKKSKLVKDIISKSKKVNKINDVDILKNKATLIYVYNGEIINVERKTNNDKFPALIYDKSVKFNYLSYSEKNNEYLLFDENYNLKEKLTSVEPELAFLLKDLECVLICNDNGKVISGFRKDLDKNKPKESLYAKQKEDLNVLFMPNQKALDGFRSSFVKNNKFKKDLRVKYNDDTELILKKNNRRILKKGF